jgi:putative endopeptidase
MMMLCALAACNQRGKGALDLTDLDPSTSPKEDFYQYATGGWQVKNPLKPEFSRFGSFDAIAETTRKNLNELFESMATLQAEPGTVDQKIADLYKMALDSTTRNALGAQPIQPYIAEIQAVKNLDELADLDF